MVRRMEYWVSGVLLVTLLTVVGCSSDENEQSNSTSQEEPAMTLILTSLAFEQESPIPIQYTCQGDNISPALAWSGAPDGTQSFALIMDDPDAPGRTWVHWVVYNLPADITGLPENVGPDADLFGGLQGQNSWRRTGYGGPCPPSGTHRYFFKLYALDVGLDLQVGASKDDLLGAMEGHILAEGQLMGTYQQS